MFEATGSSHTIEALNKIKIFTTLVDKDFRADAEILKQKVKEFAGNEPYPLEFDSVLIPEKGYFVVEFMKTTTLLNIIKSSVDLQNDPYKHAESNFQTDMQMALNKILNDLGFKNRIN